MANEKVRFFRVPDVPDVELYHTNGVSRSMPRHVHSVLSASVTVSGYRIHETRQAKHTVPPGSILVVNVGEMHSSLSNGVKSSTLAIRLLPQFLTKIVFEITGRCDGILPLREPIIQDLQLARQMLELQSVLETSSFRLEKEERIQEVFYHLYSRHSSESVCELRHGHERTSIARACEYLQDCTEENVSLETLSAIAGLSPFHFSRVFTKEVGVPPHTYQLAGAAAKSNRVACNRLFCDGCRFCDRFL